jgi:hypothetical protein
MKSFKNSFEFGRYFQTELLDLLRDFFRDHTIIETDKYNVHDYKGEKVSIELKTRRFPIWKYDTTLLPANKIRNDLDEGIDQYFFFKFTDKIGYIKYNKEKFDQFEIRQYNSYGIMEYSRPYIYIPVNELTILS